MTNLSATEIEALLRGITEGPWKQDVEGMVTRAVVGLFDVCRTETDADAAFIAAAPAIVRQQAARIRELEHHVRTGYALCDAVEAEDDEITALRAALEQAEKQIPGAHQNDDLLKRRHRGSRSRDECDQIDAILGARKALAGEGAKP